MVSNTLFNAGHSCGVLSSKLEMHERAEVIRQFRQGQIKVLVSTNVTSRGIDVEQVTFVVNYDLPDRKNPDNGKFEADCETYLHRIGRTGRFGKTGIAVNFVNGPNDKRILSEIESHFDRKIESLNVLDIDDMEEKLN